MVKKSSKRAPKKREFNKKNASPTLNTINLVEMLTQQNDLVIKEIHKNLSKVANIIDLVTKTICSKGRVFYLTNTPLKTQGLANTRKNAPVGSPNWIVVISPCHSEEENTTNKKNLGEVFVKELEKHHLKNNDLCIVATHKDDSKVTFLPLSYARKTKTATVLITGSTLSKPNTLAKVSLALNLSPETLFQGIRMKFSVAQKLFFHYLYTVVALKMKACGLKNLNNKNNSEIFAKFIKSLAQLTNLSYKQAEELYHKSGMNPRVALVMHHLKMSRTKAKIKLAKYNDSVKALINDAYHILSDKEKVLAQKAKLFFAEKRVDLKIGLRDLWQNLHKGVMKSQKNVVQKVRGNQSLKNARVKVAKFQRKLQNTLEMRFKGRKLRPFHSKKKPFSTTNKHTSKMQVKPSSTKKKPKNKEKS